jgi:hypothetical protein
MFESFLNFLAIMKSAIFLLYTFVFPFSILQGQDTIPSKSFKYIFKANINYSHPSFGTYSIGNVAPDWVIRNKKGNFHEFELTGISVNKYETLNSGTQTSSSIRFRYQYDIALIKQDRKIIPFIGLSAMAFSGKINIIPSTPIGYNKIFDAGVRVGIVPGVYFFPGKKLSIDFSMPLEFASLAYRQLYVANPNVPANQQTNSNLDFNTYFLNPLRFRLGIGLRI